MLRSFKMLRTPGGKLYVSLMLILCIVGCHAAVLACGQGRPATEAEKGYYARVINTISKAIPSGPPGWNLMRQTEIEELRCVSFAVDEGYPLPVEYGVSWENIARTNKADDAVVQALNENTTNSSSNAERDKLLNNYAQLAEQYGETLDRGDIAKANQLQAEMEQLSQTLNGVLASQDQERSDAINQNCPRDVKLDIYVCANGSVSIPPDADEIDPIAGVRVLRTKGEFSSERGWREGYSYVLLGSFWDEDISSFAGQSMELTRGLPLTQIQSIVVKVQADPKRARAVLQQIDWAALKRLLNN